MTSDSWKSFAADGPPQVGQDVLMINEINRHSLNDLMRVIWRADAEIPMGFTHWTEFIPPEPVETDGFEKWWATAKHGYRLPGSIEYAQWIWTEATRQALEQPCPHCKGKRTSGD